MPGEGQLTLEQMKIALKRYGFNDEDPLALWLNAAMHDLESSFDWPWLEVREATKTMVAGESTITLPVPALKVILLRDITNKRKLEYWNRHKFAREIQDPTEKGKPEFYTLVNTDVIQIWRVLEASTDFEIIYQTATPDLVAAGSTPTSGASEWPGVASYPIVQRAASIALQAENEEERAKAAQGQYEESLKRLFNKFAERQLDEPETVQDVMDYAGGSGRYW